MLSEALTPWSTAQASGLDGAGMDSVAALSSGVILFNSQHLSGVSDFFYLGNRVNDFHFMALHEAVHTMPGTYIGRMKHLIAIRSPISLQKLVLYFRDGKVEKWKNPTQSWEQNRFFVTPSYLFLTL